MYNISTKKEEKKMKRVVNIEIDLSNISNYALSKLTRDEICGLGLMNAGICTYQGELKKRTDKMKVLEGIEELKYTALLAAHMYDKTGNKTYMTALQHIIDETWRNYGSKGVSEVIDFIREESL